MSRLWLLVALLVASRVDAHLMESDLATVNVLGESAFCAISVPAAVIAGIDDDRDQLLSSDEANRHRSEIVRAFSERFVVTSAGEKPRIVSLDVTLSPTHSEPPDRARSVIALLHARFDHAPAAIDVHSDLFVPSGKLRVVVSNHGRSESAELRQGTSQHRFFAPTLTARIEQHTRLASGALALFAGALALLLHRRRRAEDAGDSARIGGDSKPG